MNSIFFSAKGLPVLPAVQRFILSLLILPALLFSQAAQGKFSPDDYKRVLWMVTRFYGAQRSGEGPNWLLMEHEPPEYRTSFMDKDNGYDLSGGWFDCGDHVLFGQTFFYSTYLLAKAYDLFPTGFHDHYHGWDYRDYLASGNWDWEGGTPDGVPDLLQELKYATDWIIKATPNASTFYYQKGEGDKDHRLWITAGKMAKLAPDSGGDPRKIYKNPDGGVMPSFAAATLAIMSRVIGKFDPAYANTCREHAQFAYTYARARKDRSVAADGGYYGVAKSPLMAFVAAASEMYATFGDGSYKNDATTGANGNIEFHNWGFDYSNMHDLAPLTMATSGVDEGKYGELKSMFIDQYTGSINDEGVCTRGNSGWGALRYPANHAFITAAWAKMKNDRSLDEFIFDQADYIMGANNAKQSFIVGFCSGCSKEVRLPHHRNVFLRDDNPDDEAKAQMTIPQRNKQFGYLVGGNWKSNDYKESVTDYAMTEGGIDYNAGLVGTLAYIVSQLAPADTAKMVGVRQHAMRKNIDNGMLSLGIVRNGSGWQLDVSDGRLIEEVTVFDHSGRMVEKCTPGERSVVINREYVVRGMLTIRARCSGGAVLFAHYCAIR